MVFVNPQTLQAIRRPAEMADELKQHGFIPVPVEGEDEKAVKKTAKKAKSEE